MIAAIRARKIWIRLLEGPVWPGWVQMHRRRSRARSLGFQTEGPGEHLVADLVEIGEGGVDARQAIQVADRAAVLSGQVGGQRPQEQALLQTLTEVVALEWCAPGQLQGLLGSPLRR